MYFVMYSFSHPSIQMLLAKVRVYSIIGKYTKFQRRYSSQEFVINMSTSSFETFSMWLEKRHKEKQNNRNRGDFASTTAGNLRRHLKTHSGEKSHKCNQCEYASVSADSLRRHLKTHSGEKSYKCSQCDYASIEAGNLRRHLKTHNVENIALKI